MVEQGKQTCLKFIISFIYINGEKDKNSYEQTQQEQEPRQKHDSQQEHDEEHDEEHDGWGCKRLCVGNLWQWATAIRQYICKRRDAWECDQTAWYERRKEEKSSQQS